MTWGDDGRGGNSRAVQGQLKDVQQIQASPFAFAAILGNGTVVTWGDSDSSLVQNELQGVQQIQANGSDFAAIRVDGSLVTWGQKQR